MDVSTSGTGSSAVLSSYIGSYDKSIAKSLARLASGLRVLSPADDAGSYFKASSLNQKAESLDTINRGIQTHLSKIKSAQGILETADALLSEMTSLAQEASTETNQNSRKNLGEEFDAKYDALNTLVNTARYEGELIFTGLIDSSAGGTASSLQIEEGVSDTYSYDLLDTRIDSATGLNLAAYNDASTDFNDLINGQTNAANFYAALTTGDAGQIRLERNANRITTHLTILEGAYDALTNKKENYLAASSALVGVDDAAESTRLSALQIRQQAAASFLSQSNLTYGNVIGTLTSGSYQSR